MDNWASKRYALFKKVTPDKWEPYIRVGIYAYALLGTLFIYDVLTKPQRYYDAGQIASLWGGNLPTEQCTSDVNMLRNRLGEKSGSLARCQSYASDLERSMSLLKSEVIARRPDVLGVSKPKVSASRVYRKKRRKKKIAAKTPADLMRENWGP